MADVKAGSLREKEYASSSHNESLKNVVTTGNAELDAIPDPDAVRAFIDSSEGTRATADLNRAKRTKREQHSIRP